MSALLQVDKMCSVHVDALAQVGKVDRKCRKRVGALAQVVKVDRKCRVCG